MFTNTYNVVRLRVVMPMHDALVAFSLKLYGVNM